MLRSEIRSRGRNMVHQTDVFEMSSMPVQLGKVEIAGDEWNKIQRMLEERQRMLVAKAIIVENSGMDSLYYKTLSNEQYVQELANALQKTEDVREELEEKHRLELRDYVNTNHNLEMTLRAEEIKSKVLEELLNDYKSRGFWKRVFNRKP